MSRIKDLIGKRFGRLQVVAFSYRKREPHGTRIFWTCQCDCGNTTCTASKDLRSGNTSSCGCLRVDKAREMGKHFQSTASTALITHGLSKSREYATYNAAKNRCNWPKHISWRNYGGRGIEFRFTSFEQFFAELGFRPTPQHSLDRINNEGHYEPGNVRWATRTEQRINQRKI